MLPGQGPPLPRGSVKGSRRRQDAQSVVAAAMKRCKHLGCRQAGVKSCECFGANVVRRLRYVVWARPRIRRSRGRWAVRSGRGA
jgi:hypothetical protein